MFNIQVSPCTTLNSNQAHYEMHVGDEAIVKGTQKNRIKISASHVIALDD